MSIFIIFIDLSNNLYTCCVYSVIVEQLKERRDKLRERLNHGSHKILQDYLKKEKGEWKEDVDAYLKEDTVCKSNE